MKHLPIRWIWLATLVIYLVSTMSVVHALTITHNTTADVSATASSAAIRWTTDEQATSQVTFGRSTILLNESRSNASLSTEHAITLTPLLPNTVFYYSLSSANTSGYGVTDNNLGSMYSFRTQSLEEAAQGTNQTVSELFLDADVPSSFNNRYIDVIGKTLSGATVRLYINRPSTSVGGIVYDASTVTTATGDFAFARVNLPQQQNTIDIFARQGSTNLSRHFTVAIDTDDPIVNVSLPGTVNITSLQIQGRTSEPVTATIHVNNVVSALEFPSGVFNLTLALQDESTNPVSIVFSDAAGNSVSVDKDIVVSTRPPQIYYTNLHMLNPSYAQDVIIRGNVTPGSLIVVFVNNQTTPDSAWSTSVIELVNHFGQIIDREFLGLFGEESYSTIADSSGSFDVQVKLSQEFDLGGAESFSIMAPPPPQVGPTPANIPSTTPVAGATLVSRDQFRNRVLLLVISPSGLTTTAQGEIVYTKCGTAGDWNIELSDITPGVVIPEHLRRGIAQLGFNVNFNWQGPGDVGVLRGPPAFSMVPLNAEERAKLAFDPSLLINPNSIVPVCSSDQRRCHVVMKLNRYNYTQAQLRNITYNKLSVKLPLLLEARYGTMYGGVREERTQRQCIEFNTVFDVEVPPSVIPGALLRGSIASIDAIVDVINKILRPLIIITKITFFVCLFSWVVWFVYLVYKNYTCIADGDNAQTCIDTKIKANQIDYYMRWVCDRVFCPSAPTYAKFLESPQPVGVNEKFEPVDVCLNVKNTDQFYTQEPGELFDPRALTCASAYKFKWDTACVGMDELKRSRCLEARTNRDVLRQQQFCEGPIGETFYAASGMCESSQEIANYRITRNDKIYQYVKSTDSWCELGAARTVIHEETAEQTTTRECVRTLSAKEVQDLGLGPSKRREQVVNPTEGFLTSMQCACLPGVNGYLQLWRNVLVQIKQCFQSILVTGQGSSGLCRAVLTQYLCDIIFDAISCFSQLFGDSIGARTQARGIPAFLQAMSQSGNEIQTSITERYGRTALYNTLFNERKLVHAICLFAFTGDWDLDLDQALGGLGVVPLKSEGFVYPATRRFMTSNPLQYGRTTYVYHIGAGLVVGDEVNYRLQLVCSADNSCDPDEFANGECDCYRKGQPMYYDLTRQLGPGRANAGGIAQGDIYVAVPDSPVRYDKVKLSWVSVRNITGRGAPSGEKIMDITREGGNPPAECTFDLGSLEFRCGFDVGERGYAVFAQPPFPVSRSSPIPTTGLTPTGISVPFGLGEPLRLKLAINKRSPNYDIQSPDPEKKNPENELPFYLRYQVFNGQGRLITGGPGNVLSSGQFVIPLDRDGTLDSDATPELQSIPGLVIKREHFTTESRAIRTAQAPYSEGELFVRAEPMNYSTPSTIRFIINFSDTSPAGGTSVSYDVFDVDTTNAPIMVSRQTFTYTFGASIGAIELPAKNFRVWPQAVSVDDLKGRGVIVTYEPTAAGIGTVDNCVAHASTPDMWTVQLDLVYPAKKVDELPLTRRNAQPSTEIVAFNGELQTRSVPIPVVCSQAAGLGQQCEYNKKLMSLCQCGASITTGRATYCGDTETTDYCMFPGGGIPYCRDYNICDKKNAANTPLAARVPVDDICDCDTTTLDMECSPGDFCNQIGGSTSSVSYQCQSATASGRAGP